MRVSMKSLNTKVIKKAKEVKTVGSACNYHV